MRNLKLTPILLLAALLVASCGKSRVSESELKSEISRIPMIYTVEAVAQVNIEETDAETSLLSFFGNRNIIVPIKANLKAGIDLSKLDDISIEGDKVYITLPDPVIEIESTKILHDQMITDVTGFRDDFKSSDPLAPYEGTHADDDGRVTHHPDDDERQRLLMEFQTCLAKAIDESVGEPEHCLQLLADYCAKAHLPEEGCTVRAGWVSRFRTIGADVVRKTFRNAYKKPLGDCPLSQMNEKERIIRSIEGFLTRRYQLRFNVVKQQREFRPNDLHFRDWRPLTDRELKSIVVEEMKEGGESWMNDLRTYIESAHISDYNPVHEFLAGCGRWDGRRNYIEDFARYLTTDYADWPRYFHRWFLAMVAQALNLNRDYGNSMVPLLIGTQGVRKSTFCKNILPPAMREYYMDDIKMDNAEQVERVLGRMWLVCIDEYNAKTPREQAKIKRLLTEKDVQVRRMRSDHYKSTARLCSFIATTNDQHPLTDPTGSRRYMCVEANGPIDMSGVVAYQQMYAQAVDELENGERYWFTSDEEREIEAHNRQFQQTSTVEEIICTFFAGADKQKEWFMTSTSIQQVLRKHLSAADVPTLKRIGMAMKQLRMPEGQCNNVHGYYLRIKN